MSGRRLLLLLSSLRQLTLTFPSLSLSLLPPLPIPPCPRAAPGDGAPQIATFASGCFWGTEHIFLKHFPPAQGKGVLRTAVGYTGGKADATDPDYRTVCSGATDHAEAVRIEFDPAVVGYEELVGECSVRVEMEGEDSEGWGWG